MGYEHYRSWPDPVGRSSGAYDAGEPCDPDAVGPDGTCGDCGGQAGPTPAIRAHKYVGPDCGGAICCDLSPEGHEPCTTCGEDPADILHRGGSAITTPVGRPTFFGARAIVGDPEDERCERCGWTYALHRSPDGQAPAECPELARPARPSRAVRDLLRVARAYASLDDWGVRTVYWPTLRDLADDLAAGDDPDAIAAHAKHVGGATCARAHCADRAPHHIATGSTR